MKTSFILKQHNIVMKNTIKTKSISLALASSILFTSCASTTMIETSPKGAQVYISDEHVGETPYSYKDTKIVGSCSSLKLKKEGYETLQTNLCRNEQADVGAIIAGFFFIVPFLWIMKYKPTHRYELTPITNSNEPKNKD